MKSKEKRSFKSEELISNASNKQKYKALLNVEVNRKG